MAKRIFDLLVAIPLLLFLLPLILMIVLLIELESPGSPFYISRRYGQYGKVFNFYNFRAICADAPSPLPMAQKLTRIGRFIRNISLDHLPQLFNVIRGDMSIVGPRPMELDRINLDDPGWQEALAVKPGTFSLGILTLANQYNASDIDLKKQIEQDYARHSSLRFDLRIIGRYLLAFWRSRGNIKARGTPTTLAQENDKFKPDSN
jgi:lipopolysaccharide/colanic/teichoic acid biosynthesis glycosyltransferase